MDTPRTAPADTVWSVIAKTFFGRLSMPQNHKGLFVTFEGIDGTGKTTCVFAVKRVLEADGIDVATVRFPGCSSIGGVVRDLLFVDPTTKAMAPGVADLLFAADHVQGTEHVLRPALATGAVVLCDRYADSQRAYSSHPSKATPPWAAGVFEATSIEPDLTFLFICDPTIAWARSKARAADPGKQDAKSWGGPAIMGAVQLAYIEALTKLDRTVLLNVDHMDAATVAAAVALRIKEAYEYSPTD